MPELSPECLATLRDLEGRLGLVLSRLAESAGDPADLTKSLLEDVRRWKAEAFSSSQLDEECLRALAGIEPRLAMIVATSATRRDSHWIRAELQQLRSIVARQME